MKKLLILTKFHFKTTAANKAFLIITLIGPLLILGVSVVPGLLTNRLMVMEEGTVVGLVGAAPELQRELMILSGGDIAFQMMGESSAARQAALDGDLAGVLEAPSEVDGPYLYYSPTGSDIVVYETLRGIVGRAVVARRMALRGWDPEEVRTLSQYPEFDIQKIGADGEVSRQQSFQGLIYTAIGFIMLLYMTVLLYGQMIGRSVVTEKTSKTVELMLSSVKPWELMFGKILGLGLAGILQYLFWIALSMILIKGVGPRLGLSLPPTLSPGNLGYLFLFFIFAFFIYSSLYAALGAASEDEQNLGQLAWPLLIFLVLPLMLVAALVANPDGPLTVGLSIFPLTAPLVMFVRVLVKMPLPGTWGSPSS